VRPPAPSCPKDSFGEERGLSFHVVRCAVFIHSFILHYLEVVVKNIVLTFFVLAVLTLPMSVVAQVQKIGYVNSSKILQEFPEAQEAQKKIDAMQKTIQDELEKRQAELKAKYEDYQKKESMMNEAAKRAAQDEFSNLQRKYEEFRVEKLGSNSELAKESERLLDPIKEKVIKAIERVAKDDKYTFVFDKTEQVNLLLYGDNNHDLTFKVIDKLRRGK